jgi:hypothetical protein
MTDSWDMDKRIQVGRESLIYPKVSVLKCLSNKFHAESLILHSYRVSVSLLSKIILYIAKNL